MIYARTKVYPHFVINGVNDVHLTLDRDLTDNALTFDSVREAERLFKDYKWGIEIIDSESPMHAIG